MKVSVSISACAAPLAPLSEPLPLSWPPGVLSLALTGANEPLGA
eukprot:CAMPEP_0181280076 /NCGR_PEP_ID=MMETSP1097-20121128/12728_1 /TAXON_ID=35684 /ORGANISM="Pseudopedinella elastica, Strain CCMP716" /LENGTH=43 /DNA_ID= /DNA_START= /DNA_END= /DNA_ORIENTATION=